MVPAAAEAHRADSNQSQAKDLVTDLNDEGQAPNNSPICLPLGGVFHVLVLSIPAAGSPTAHSGKQRNVESTGKKVCGILYCALSGAFAPSDFLPVCFTPYASIGRERGAPNKKGSCRRLHGAPNPHQFPINVFCPNECSFAANGQLSNSESSTPELRRNGVGVTVSVRRV